MSDETLRVLPDLPPIPPGRVGIFDPAGGLVTAAVPRYRADPQEPVVTASSRVERDWHLLHLFRWPGCRRWVTRVEVQGAPTVVIVGKHLDE